MLEQCAYFDWVADRLPPGGYSGNSQDLQIGEGPAEWGFVYDMVHSICEADMLHRAERPARAPAGAYGGEQVQVVVRAGWRLHEVVSVESIEARLSRGGAGRVDARGPDAWNLGALGGSQRVPGEMLWQAAPAVWGYSFQARKWGWALLSGIREVAWAPGALEGLVLPRGHRDVLTAMLAPTPGVCARR